MDSKKDIRSDVILENSGLDNPTCYNLLKSLVALHYIIYTYDTITVLSLGENNYHSPLNKFLSFIGWRIWDLVIFIAGIFSGVAITYISHILLSK